MLHLYIPMLVKAANHGQIIGLLSNLNGIGIICMKYADDTVLFLQNDLAQVKKIKMDLVLF
jgi:hypothetical protein